MHKQRGTSHPSNCSTASMTIPTTEFKLLATSRWHKTSQIDTVSETVANSSEDPLYIRSVTRAHS
eukprot:8290356-Lingulodinium_polyedra.AAC.1